MSTNDVYELPYFIVHPVTGVILRAGQCSAESVNLQPQGNELLVISDNIMAVANIDDDTHYWNGTTFVEFPTPRPLPWAQWSGSEWFDPMPPNYAEQQEAARLAQARSVAALDKSNLLIAMMQLGMMDEGDAIVAASGDIPPSLLPMLDSLPPEAQAVARIKWKADNVISRTNPVIALAAFALGVTDAQLDQIFGVA